MKIAVFDIDGTLMTGASERLFFRYLAKRGYFRFRQLLGYLLFLIRYLPTGGIHTTKKNKAYLSGLATEEIEALAEDFVESELPAYLFEPAIQRLKQHKVRGDKIVLLSGTLDCIARALGRRLNADQVYATVCAQRNGIYLAQPPEIHPFDTAKLSLAKRVAERHGVGLSQLVAYGDSHHDLYLLASVGGAVAVRPDEKLDRVAQDMGWEIIGEAPLPGPLPS